MALVKCPECGNEISKKAESCPHCGHKNKSTGGIGPSILLGVALFIAVMIVVNIVISDKGSSNSTISHQDEYSETYIYTSKYYAHKTINVRDKPTTDSEILYQVNRGDVVRIKPTSSDWAEVYSDDSLSGYIYKPLLEKNPIPPLEIASWNWRSDKDFGLDGAIIWNVEIRNNTSRYIENVRVEFSTYDSDDNLITSDYTYVKGLSPGGSRTAKSYATYFGTEEIGKIKISDY